MKTSQREIEYAAGMIEILSELARAADETDTTSERFELGAALEKAMERVGPELSARGLRVVRPSSMPSFPLLGDRKELEQALTDILSGAAAHSVQGECRVLFEKSGAEARVIVRVPAGLSASSPEALFRLARRMDGSPSGSGLFLARWTFESLGGRLEAVLDGTTLAFTASAPAGDA